MIEHTNKPQRDVGVIKIRCPEAIRGSLYNCTSYCIIPPSSPYIFLWINRRKRPYHRSVLYPDRPFSYIDNRSGALVAMVEMEAMIAVVAMEAMETLVVMIALVVMEGMIASVTMEGMIASVVMEGMIALVVMEGMIALVARGSDDSIVSKGKR